MPKGTAGKIFYDFRILLETKQGKQFSYISQSFFDSTRRSNFVMSSSDAWNGITGSVSCSYQNSYNFSGSEASGDIIPAYRLKDNPYLSSSLNGTVTGSIGFYTNNATGSDKDSLRRFKFLGCEKVCTALSLPHDFWVFTDEFRLISGSERHFFKGDVVAQSLHVVNNMVLSNRGTMDSDLPFRINKNSDRYIKFIKSSASIAPHNDLIIGYNDILDQYWISASNHPDGNNPVTFNIGGVTNISASGAIIAKSLNVTSITSSYSTSSVSQIFTEITSSGNSIFGDENTDNHQFLGNVSILGGGESTVSHSVDGLTVAGDISASGEIYSAGASSSFGTNTPSGPGITVAGDISSSGHLYLENAKNIRWITTAGPARSFISVGSVDSFQLGFASMNLGETTIYGTQQYITISGSSTGALGSGNVGIGNAEPSKTLTVAGDISASGDLFGKSTSGVDFGIISASSTELTAAGDISASGDLFLGGNEIITAGNQVGGTGKFTVIAGATGASLLTISASGGTAADNTKVAIGQGINDPIPSMLTVKGDISASGNLYVNNAAAGAIIGQNVAGTKDGIAVEGDITASGDVYIGTYEGESRLYINKYSDSATYAVIETGNGMQAPGPIGMLFRYTGDYGTSIHAMLISGSTGYVRIGGQFIASAVVPKTLTVDGDISASGKYYPPVGGEFTVEGDISASGGLYIEPDEVLYFNSPTMTDDKIFYSSADDKMTLMSANIKLHSQTGVQIGAAEPAVGGLTVDGDISASGKYYPPVGGEFTVAGDISASGHLYLENNKSLYWRESTNTAAFNFINFDNSNLFSLGQSAFETKIYGDGAILTLSESRFGFGNFHPSKTLTVDGDISASGKYYPPVGGEFTVAGDISASGHLYLKTTNRNIYMGNQSYIHHQDTAGTNISMMNIDSNDLMSFGSIINNMETVIYGQGISLRLSGSAVGIGTNTPSKTLTVKGDISASGDLHIMNSSSFGTNLTSSATVTVQGDISASGDIHLGWQKRIVWQSGSAHKEISIYGNDGLMSIRSGSIGRHILHDFQTGYVGFGNLNPTKALTVAGDISASGVIFGDSLKKSSGNTTDEYINFANSHIINIGDPEEANNSTILAIDDVNQKVTINKPLAVNTETPAINMELTVKGDISASGIIYLENGKGLTNTAGSAYMAYTGQAGSGYTGLFISQSKTYIGVNQGFERANIPKTLTVKGDISASGDLFVSRSFINTIDTGSNKALTVAGDISASGDLYVEDIYHQGDVDTGIIFGSDNIILKAGNTTFAQFRESGTNSIYFRNANVQIGAANTAPPKALTVSGSISASGDFILGHSGSATSGYISASNGSLEMSGSGLGLTVGSWTDGYHGNDEFIQILPADCDNISPSGRGSYLQLDGGYLYPWHTNSDILCQKTIPRGFTATHVDMYGPNNEDFIVYKGEIDTDVTPAVGNNNMNTQCTLTEPVSGSDGKQYLTIHVDTDAAGDHIYGGKITITRTI